MYLVSSTSLFLTAYYVFTQTLGLVRVPVSDSPALANFFLHNFVGNARDQLVEILIKRNILKQSEIDAIWNEAAKQVN